MDVDPPPDGREQGVLKKDEEVAQGPGVILTVSPSRLAPNPTSLDQSCVTLSPGASSIVSLLSFYSHMDKPD